MSIRRREGEGRSGKKGAGDPLPLGETFLLIGVALRLLLPVLAALIGVVTLAYFLFALL